MSKRVSRVPQHELRPVSRETAPPQPQRQRFRPLPGVLCERCGAVHRDTECNDHRQGDPPTQCKRARARDSDLCWFHVKQDVDPGSSTSRTPLAGPRRDSLAGEALAVDNLTATTAQLLDDPAIAALLPDDTDDDRPTPPGGPAGPVSRETGPLPPQPGAGVGSPSTDLHTTGRRPFVPLMSHELQPLFDPTAALVDNPVLDLARVAGILKHAFEQAGHRVNELSSVSVETRAGGEQLRGEILLWEKLLNHLRSVLVDMAKLNLEERLVRIDEVRADRVAEALFWLLGSLVQRLELDRTRAELAEDLMRSTVHRIVTMGTALDSTSSAGLIRP